MRTRVPLGPEVAVAAMAAAGAAVLLGLAAGAWQPEPALPRGSPPPRLLAFLRAGTLDDAIRTAALLGELDRPLPARSARPDVGYRLPVAGSIAEGFGEVGPNGIAAQAITVSAAPAAPVVAPAAGRIVFAGRFRGYQRLIIVDHGQGRATVISGLDRIDVRVGREVASGESIGIAPAAGGPVGVELRINGRPADPMSALGSR